MIRHLSALLTVAAVVAFIACVVLFLDHDPAWRDFLIIGLLNLILADLSDEEDE